MNSCTIALKLDVSVVKTVVGALLDALALFFGFRIGPPVRSNTCWLDDDEPCGSGILNPDPGRIRSRLRKDGFGFEENGLRKELGLLLSKKIGWFWFWKLGLKLLKKEGRGE